MTILIVEDDPVLARGLQLNLHLENHKTVLAADIKTATAMIEANKIEFVILDLGLPDGSGFDLLQTLRSKADLTPVIVLTAQIDEDSVVRGLELGANDYMKKPYSFKELNARMKVILKKPALDHKVIAYDDLKLNLDTRSVSYNGRTLDLARREFDFLAYFVQRAEMIVSRDSLINLTKKEGEIFDRTIDSHISHLRKKLR